MNTVADLARQEAIAQGASPESVDPIVNLAVGVAYFTLVLVAVIELFVVLCGLKCSMQGKWRTGAIVFGVLLLIGSFFSVTQKGAAWTSWVDLVLGILYLVGAIMCKPDLETSQPNTVEFKEEKKDEF